MKVIIFTIYLSVISITVFAQYGKDFRGLGDRAFTNKDYFEAAFYYKQAAAKMHLVKPSEIPFQNTDKKVKDFNASDMLYIEYRLAESYRLYQNYLEAEPWYQKVQQTDDSHLYPLATLWYGVCLRANQHFDDALKQFEQFVVNYKQTDNYKTTAIREIEICKFAIAQYQYPQLFFVNQMAGDWNSGEGSDYSIIKKDSVFWLTSSRYLSESKRHLNKVYTYSGNTSGKPVAIVFSDNDKQKDVEYGTPSLSPDGKRMYITRWYKKDAKTFCAIYSSTWQNNQWDAIKKLNSNVNKEGYIAMQPFVTSDGKKLFFTSNRPGGQGGDDIWMADLGPDGDAINSTNLGGVINTPMDEQAANYDVVTNRLVYSSKGFTGLGGFDFFESQNQNGLWSTPHNLGYPINSAKDDLYFFPDGTNPKKFYISSDRESDCCLNVFEIYDKSLVLTGIVTDCATNKPLAGVSVRLIDSINKTTVGELTTGTDARYAFTIKNKRPLSISLEKKGYFTKILPIALTGKVSNDSLYNPDFCLQSFEKDKPIVIENILYDFNKAVLRPESKVVLDKLAILLKDNPNIHIELGSHTDSIGSEKYNLKLSQDRAQACVDYIISNGISDKRIFAKGYGKSKPIAPNSLPNGKDNPEGRQLNRRTEFTVVKIDE